MGKGVVSKWVGRQGGNFVFGDFDEKEARDPVIIYDVKTSRRRGRWDEPVKRIIVHPDFRRSL